MAKRSKKNDDSIEQSVRGILAKNYARVIVPDGEASFMARILEFPGCFSEGATVEEAYKNLEDAAFTWVEHLVQSKQAVPEPFEDSEYSGNFTIRVSPSTHRRAAEVASYLGQSLNRFVGEAIQARIDKPTTLSGGRLAFGGGSAVSTSPSQVIEFSGSYANSVNLVQ